MAKKSKKMPAFLMKKMEEKNMKKPAKKAAMKKKMK